jgi:uridine monophosphate synthetase
MNGIAQSVVDVMLDTLGETSFDVLCGVPYTALPLATVMAMQLKRPMVVCRKEGPKEHGHRRQIEGLVHPGDTCVVIEDVVSSGASVLDIVEPLQAAGLTVRDVLVLIDREQGARAQLARHNLNVHAVCTLTQVLTCLLTHQRVTHTQVQTVTQFVTQQAMATMVKPLSSSSSASSSSSLTYGIVSIFFFFFFCCCFFKLFIASQV